MSQGAIPLETKTSSESREYPSRLFFMDLLLKEVQKSGEAGTSLNDVLDQLRVIWAARNREAVLTRLENHASRHTSYRFPDEMQGPVADALSDLMRAADDLKPGDRQKADFSISRIVRYLDTPHQLYVLAPWMEDTRRFRENTVIRTLRAVKDLSPYAEYVVNYYRKYEKFETLQVIARSTAASALIEPVELAEYFNRYFIHFKSKDRFHSKSDKYQAMIAARVLIVGNRSIPSELIEHIPEIFTWAIEHIGDPAYEPLLTWLVVENPENPEVLWSAVRTANRHFMENALEQALNAARSLLLREEGVFILPPEFNNEP